MVETEIPTESRECNACGIVFDSRVVRIGTKTVFVNRLCDGCAEKERAERAERMGRQDYLDQLWRFICPPLYDDTDIEKIRISHEIVAEVLAWQPNPRGIGLSGESGTGKTRLMFLLLKRLNYEKHKMVATSAKKFENWCHRMFDKDDDARIHIKAAHETHILFIDDIGKEKYTERVESEFYDLIEDRTAHKLPILWTANASGDKLQKMLGEDRGVPIVRRLREFTEIISV